MFAPTSQRKIPTFNRTRDLEHIIRANTERRTFVPASAFGRVSLLEFLASRGMVSQTVGGEDLDDNETLQQCATQ